MQVEMISHSWDRFGVCTIRSVHGGIVLTQERSIVRSYLTGEFPEDRN